MKSDSLDKIITEMDELIKTLQFLHTEISKFKWIGIKDTVPVGGRLVLMTNCIDIATGNYKNGKWWIFNKDVHCETITHWMELPNIPEKQ